MYNIKTVFTINLTGKIKWEYGRRDLRKDCYSFNDLSVLPRKRRTKKQQQQKQKQKKKQNKTQTNNKLLVHLQILEDRGKEININLP